ncbi:hypothetical protein HFO56_23160 [Rhizobium laguerreae]|uniref:hypothetical protein n=1 Tax=Rhizobium laguerreae TaxID=1076926 RepID=UPI001C91A7BE|nr:hypothetical protein [Rhizobium laguerreae]MBY3155225.1 hypothetical protein [Rhizobium laguerreae]MBY3432726.1 hypothetical protein [Rhizobium laguerreae]
MPLADNDNAPTLTLVTNHETVARFRALRRQLDVESDAELVEIALEAMDHATLAVSTNFKTAKMDASLCLSLPRETLATLAEECMRTGRSYEATIRYALRALAAVALRASALETELAS